jgi:hypothetical protein
VKTEHQSPIVQDCILDRLVRVIGIQEEEYSVKSACFETLREDLSVGFGRGVKGRGENCPRGVDLIGKAPTMEDFNMRPF